MWSPEIIPNLAPQLLGRSGKVGIFVSCLRADAAAAPVLEPVRWTQRERDEADDTYLRRVYTIATADRCALALRLGCTSFLGIRDAKTTATTRHRYAIFGVPDFWSDLGSVLKLGGWLDIAEASLRPLTAPRTALAGRRHSANS